MNKRKKFQPIRFDGPLTHKITKNKTPTMGGLPITLSLLLSILLFCDLKSPYVLSLLCIAATFSFIGFLDDVIKVFLRNTDGFRGSKKLILQLLITSACVYYLIYNDIEYLTSGVFLPLFNIEIPLYNFVLVFYVLIVCGAANATNITDGLDGLLTMPVIFVSITLAIITILFMTGYAVPNIHLESELLNNLLIILVSIVAIFIAFLIFNAYPAEIFMGDVGSLMIGAVLCYISILLKVEMFFAIMSLLFIWEILSTIIQAACILLTHDQKRIFKMAPFHHHLEQCGWREKKIVLWMWGFSFCSCIVALVLFLI